MNTKLLVDLNKIRPYLKQRVPNQPFEAGFTIEFYQHEKQRIRVIQTSRGIQVQKIVGSGARKQYYSMHIAQLLTLLHRPLFRLTVFRIPLGWFNYKQDIALVEFTLSNKNKQQAFMIFFKDPDNNTLEYVKRFGSLALNTTFELLS